jgi:hypothetical protein
MKPSIEPLEQKMFGIKMRETDVWAGKKGLTYFVSDDADFVCRGTLPHSRLCFGVDKKYRRIFGSTEEIRRALSRVSRETVWVGGFVKVLGSGQNLGSFSHYEVVDLVTGLTHPLDDVIRKTI